MPLKTIILTSIPSPYRVIVFNQIYKTLGNDFMVFYTAKKHPAFDWNEEVLCHNHKYISAISKESLYRNLKIYNPDIVITCGFNSLMLKAMIYTFLFRKKRVANTDAWALNEKSYSFLHILIRKIMYKHMQAFIPVSIKGYNNFKRYKISEEKIFISHYAVDNDYSFKFINSKKKFDVMFSGQFIDRKMPFFFCEIIETLFKKRKNLKVLLIGSGELKEQVINRLKNSNIDFTYAGFIQKEELPLHYASCKLFLFPTKVDSWGVVANDSCAVGTPVITCDNAGAANDLVLHDYNGYVLPLDADIWVKHIELLLDNEVKYNLFSKNCLAQISKFNSKEAAEGIISAINYLQ